MIKHYLQIIKPRIIFSNLISVIGGFLFASKGIINYYILLEDLLGVSLIVASSCVFNNVLDRDIDMKMQRTQNRVLVKGLVSVRASLIYALVLGICGFVVLFFFANLIVIYLAILGFLVYVCIYSICMKRYSIHSILSGSISGAVPPLIGYCSVTNRIDVASLILMTIFSLWQMPHSYAIGILYFQDYHNAKVPVLPVVKGIYLTKNYIIFYMISFMIATVILFLAGFTGYKYLFVTSIINIWWFIIAVSGYNTSNDIIWARKVFLFSIISITVLSLMISVDFIL